MEALPKALQAGSCNTRQRSAKEQLKLGVLDTRPGDGHSKGQDLHKRCRPSLARLLELASSGVRLPHLALAQLVVSVQRLPQPLWVYP